MQNLVLWMGFGLLIIDSAVAIFMAGRDYKAPNAARPTTSPVAQSSTDSSESGKQTETELTVTGVAYSFSQNTIDSTAGEEVKIIFKNTGRLPHNLVIDELNASTKTIGAGQTDTIIIKADKTGTYTFYCSVGNH